MMIADRSRVKAAIPALHRELVKSQEWHVRPLLLRSWAESRSPIVPTLMEFLKDKYPFEVRRARPGLWGSIGPTAKAAVPALLELLRNKDHGARQGAAWALGRIGPGPRPRFRPSWNCSRTTMLCPAGHRRGLGGYWSGGEDRDPALMGILRSGASACGSANRAEPSQKARSRRQGRRPDADGVAQGRGSAGSGVGSAKPWVRLLPKRRRPFGVVGLLKENKRWGQNPAAEALGTIGPAAIPALADLLKSDDVEVRRTTFRCSRRSVRRRSRC